MRGRRVALRLVLGLIGVGAVAGIGWETAIRSVDTASILTDDPPATPVATDRTGLPLAVVPTNVAREAYPRALHELGDWLPRMTVAIEDRRFFSHVGVDPISLTGAAIRNLRHGRTVSGASTITQQLVKITSRPTPRTFGFKAREAFRAMALERHLSKAKILEAYLNRLDYGNRRIGAEAASGAYFGKPAARLTLGEAIFLAGLPQSPSRLDPWRNPAAARARYERNVRHLARYDLLPPGVTADELLQTVPVVIRRDPPQSAPDVARLAVRRDASGSSRDLTTTIDLSLQQTLSRLAQDHLRSLKTANVRDVAIVVLENSTSEIRALVEAGESRHAAIDAVLEPRHAGSTLKPFLYLQAIDRRILTAATILPDTAEAITAHYSDYDPQNFSGRFRGPVRVREALGNSLNVPAVSTLARLGARRTFDELSGWGLDFAETFDEAGAGFILGNARVTPLGLASAYAALARGGIACPARLTLREAATTRRVASVEACSIITDILCDDHARRLSFGPASVLSLPWRTAVKTGTSSGFRDGWCAGFNGTHTVVVWVGNLDGSPMDGILALRSAAPLWAAVMTHLDNAGDEPLSPLKPTDQLGKLEIAAETGLLPRPGEPVLTEWFLKGTEPTASAASEYSNGIRTLPAEYAGWCASPHNHLRARVQEDTLQIVFPRDGSTFVLNESLPAAQQALIPQASRDAGEWFLNGQKLIEASIPLARGSWELTAIQGSSRASIRFNVE